MSKKLLSPEAVRALLRGRYQNRHRSWLGGSGSWPLVVSLGEVVERDVDEAPQLVRGWVHSWSTWTGRGAVRWEERQWPRLGTQRLPAALVIDGPLEVAEEIGEDGRWARAAARRALLVHTWPGLGDPNMLGRHFDLLADYCDQDFARLVGLLAWIECNPNSGCYVRQLPISGMDTKWLDGKRRGVLVDLLQGIRGDFSEHDFYRLCGLRRSPHRVRMRVLCPDLRAAVGGLIDVEAPLEQLAALRLRPACTLVVENLETGLALPDLPGVVAFMKLGTGVSVLASLPWVRESAVVYWGDLDSHGFAILNHARGALRQLRSVLMDEHTMLSHRELWVEERTPYASAELPHLTEPERAVFAKLKADTYGRAVRLEQERIGWSLALERVRDAVRHGAMPRIDVEEVEAAALDEDHDGGREHAQCGIGAQHEHPELVRAEVQDEADARDERSVGVSVGETCTPAAGSLPQSYSAKPTSKPPAGSSSTPTNCCSSAVVAALVQRV
jgi:hypothetical protein